MFFFALPIVKYYHPFASFAEADGISIYAMLVLFETPAGFALFKLHDENKLKQAGDLFSHFQSIDSAKELITLSHFEKFADTADALSSATALIEGKVNGTLEGFITKSIIHRDLDEKLAVADKKLGAAIKEKFPRLDCVSDTFVMELFRCIRFQLNDLLAVEGNVASSEILSMSRGLAHSLGRYKLKFSPDKVDVMIVQAISLLDDLDKEINTYSMRVKEWYGWHFPELTRILSDNLVYARLVKLVGARTNIGKVDLTDILDETAAATVQKAAQVSMGTDISDEDISHIQDLSTQIIDICEYREELNEYIKSRMRAIAPNLTILVGELVGARLIAHAGSLINLAKHPASTVQILGAEKALFRALKTKKATPKYGLIYHASLVGQATPKNKGKISRILANKAALSCRVDALGDEDTKPIGMANLIKVTTRLSQVDGKQISLPPLATTTLKKYEKPTESPAAYSEAMDIVNGSEKFAEKKAEKTSEETEEKSERKKQKKEKKEKKKRKRAEGTEEKAPEENDKESPKKKQKS